MAKPQLPGDLPHSGAFPPTQEEQDKAPKVDQTWIDALKQKLKDMLKEKQDEAKQ